MSTQRYPEEFKIEAVKQITERGHKVADVSSRLGGSHHSLSMNQGQAADAAWLQPSAEFADR